MYCSHCGKEIPNGSKFCPECGFDISTKSAENTYDTKDNANHNKKKIPPLSIFALIISFLWLYSIVGVFFAVIDICMDKSNKYNHVVSFIALTVGVCVFAISLP